MLGLINAISTMAVTILILFSQEILELGAVGHGILLTAGAAGGVVGGIAGPRVVARIGGQRSVMLALGLMPVPFMIIALTSAPVIVGAALFVEMIAALLWNIVTVSYRQRLIPDDLLGRVNALYRFFGWGMMPIGALAGGWVVSLVQPELGRELALRAPYLLGAVGSLLMMADGWKKLRLK